MNFYIYKWFIVETNKIFYIGKGKGNRYKQLSHRNKMFSKTYQENNCSVEIIEYFETEKEAFAREYDLICQYKSVGECWCNLDNGGKGGCHFVWTNDMRKYYSTYNVMKSANQRERMSINNPMKNLTTKQKVIDKKSKTIVYNGKQYKNSRELANLFNVGTTAVYYWIKRGYGRNKTPCYYLDAGQKDFVVKTHQTSNKPVIVDGIYFKNVKEGAESIGVWSETLIRAIKENRKCKGHQCEYANQQPSHTNTDKSSVEGSTTNG